MKYDTHHSLLFLSLPFPPAMTLTSNVVIFIRVEGISEEFLPGVFIWELLEHKREWTMYKGKNLVHMAKSEAQGGNSNT